MVAHKWRPIAPLPAAWSHWASEDLEEIHALWLEIRGKLEATGQLSGFLQQIRREWAIETGVIEGVYQVDKGVTETLIEKGIDAAFIPHGSTDEDPEFVAQVVRDQADALEHIFALVKEERPLTVGFIKQLHAALVRNQDTYTVVDQNGRAFKKALEKGDFKTHPNSPRRHEDGEVHEYCPPEHTASEMDNLVAFYQQHEHLGVSPDVSAAWLHHAFTQIHPFADGNGRVARALASAVLIKNHLFPLTIAREARVPYIESLERADAGDLTPLVQRISQSLRQQLVRALRLVTHLQPVRSVSDEIAGIEKLLVAAGDIPPKEWMKALELADSLAVTAGDSLQQIATSLEKGIGARNRNFQFHAGGTGSREPRVLQAVAQLGYQVNSQYESGRAISLQTKEVRQIVVSFNGYGERFHGIIAVCVFLSGPNRESPVRLAVDKPFLIRFDASEPELRAKFADWLNNAAGAAVRLWGGGV
jgi:Fic family protein